MNTFSSNSNAQIGFVSTMSDKIDKNLLQLSVSKGNLINDSQRIRFNMGMSTGRMLDRQSIDFEMTVLPTGPTQKDSQKEIQSGLSYTAKVGADYNTGWFDIMRLGYFIRDDRSIFTLSGSPIGFYYDRNANGGTKGYLAHNIGVNYIRDIGEKTNIELTGNIGILDEKNENTGTYKNTGVVRSGQIRLNRILNPNTILMLGAGINDQVIKDASSPKMKNSTNRLVSVGVLKNF